MTAIDEPTTPTTASPYPDTGAKPRPDLHPRGVNHLALSTADIVTLHVVLPPERAPRHICRVPFF